ncbi:MAG: hypothetical protein ACTSUK_09815 [Promethearchaeota archaeon]
MAKISEVIKIYPGMANTVNLKFEFLNLDANRRRMMGYKPIRSHREIFLKIAKSFLPNENKVHLLVGHYGTGKSHLLLMLANYFSQTLEMPELKEFFNNFDKADRNISKQIQSLRGDGRYLVIIPDYESQEDFSENLLSALEESFRLENFEQEIDSVYKEALRVLDQWESEDRAGRDPLHKFSAFQEALEKEPGFYNSLTTLKNGLQEYAKNALVLFKDLYRRLIGTEFRYAASNIVHILKDVIASDAFNKRFKGIVILYDEFDYTLKNRRISIEVVQQFAELCRNTNKILFVGSLHKELPAFANEYSVQDFRTVRERFKTIDMRSEGLEEIATAIVSVKKDHPLFKKQVEPNLQQVYSKIPDIQRLNLFNWLKPAEIKEKIIDAVYPLHPLTMACLLNLSTTIGSQNRTLFTFLGGEGVDEGNAYSYKSFIENNEILTNNGLLNLYSTDLLVEYFQQELDINNTDLREAIKKIVSSYYTSFKELKNHFNQEQSLFDDKDSIYEQILKLMLIFEIVGIAKNEANMAFGLNIQIKDKPRLKNALKLLTQQKVIFLNPASQVYEFRGGTNIDWDAFIRAEKERLVESGEYDLASDFLKIYKTTEHDQYLEAIKYNSAHVTDKRLLRKFEMVKNFAQPILVDGQSIDYFQYYENQLKNITNWKESYDGIIIYIIAETEDEIREARQKAKMNHSDYIMVVAPDQPIEILDYYLNLKAAKNVQQSDEYRSAQISDQSRLDESYIGDINSGYVKLYVDQRNKYIGGRLSTYFGKDGEIIETKPNSEQEPVSKFLNRLYPKFNNLTDEDINRCHKMLSSNKRMILRDAINDLLESGQVIKIDTNFGNDKGFIRYLKNVFFRHQLLKKVEKRGSYLFCEIEKDYSKYQDVVPALVDMISEIKSSNRVNLSHFIQKYRHAPYGLGEVTLELFMAYLLKYFGDELSYKKDPNAPGEITVQSFEQIVEMVNSADPQAVLEKRNLGNLQKEFLKDLYKIFSKKSLPVGVIPRLAEVKMEMQNWWDKLPMAARTEDFYSDERIVNFLQLMRSISHYDAFRFLFYRLQTIWGYDEDDRLDEKMKQKIIEGLVLLKSEIENEIDKIENTIFEGFCDIFKAEGQTYSDLEEAIQNWYNSLDANQTDMSAPWHTPQTKPLITFLKDTQNLRQTIFERIPGSNDFGLGKVKEWNTSNIKVYLEKVRAGLNTIEDNRILVDMPLIEVKEVEQKQVLGNNEVIIVYDDEKDCQLIVKVPDNAKEVWIGYKGEDPSSDSAQKEKINTSKEIKIKKSISPLILISVDGEGNFSQALKIEFKQKFKQLIKEDIFGWQVKKPDNASEAKVIIKGFINELLENNKINKSEVITVLEYLIKEYKNGN